MFFRCDSYNGWHRHCGSERIKSMGGSPGIPLVSASRKCYRPWKCWNDTQTQIVNLCKHRQEWLIMHLQWLSQVQFATILAGPASTVRCTSCSYPSFYEADISIKIVLLISPKSRFTKWVFICFHGESSILLVKKARRSDIIFPCLPLHCKK